MLRQSRNERMLAMAMDQITVHSLVAGGLSNPPSTSHSPGGHIYVRAFAQMMRGGGFPHT